MEEQSIAFRAEVVLWTLWLLFGGASVILGGAGLWRAALVAVALAGVALHGANKLVLDYRIRRRDIV